MNNLKFKTFSECPPSDVKLIIIKDTLESVTGFYKECEFDNHNTLFRLYEDDYSRNILDGIFIYWAQLPDIYSDNTVFVKTKTKEELPEQGIDVYWIQEDDGNVEYGARYNDKIDNHCDEELSDVYFYDHWFKEMCINELK